MTKCVGIYIITHRCLSFCSGGSPCDHYLWCLGSHCTGPSGHPPSPNQTWDPPPPAPAPSPSATDIWWPTLETFSNSFTRDPKKQYLVVATEACTICKLAIPIPLECFLVHTEITQSFQVSFGVWISNSWVTWACLVTLLHRKSVAIQSSGSYPTLLD